MSNSGLFKNSPGDSLEFIWVKETGDFNDLGDFINQGVIKVNAGGSITLKGPLTNGSNGEVKMLGGTLAATDIKQIAGRFWFYNR